MEAGATNGFGVTLTRTRPSLSNCPFSLQASDFDIRRTMSPFCSVQTFSAMSPLPRGIELFSFVPRELQVTSFTAAKRFSCADKAMAAKITRREMILGFVTLVATQRQQHRI